MLWKYKTSWKKLSIVCLIFFLLATGFLVDNFFAKAESQPVSMREYEGFKKDLMDDQKDAAEDYSFEKRMVAEKQRKAESWIVEKRVASEKQANRQTDKKPTVQQAVQQAVNAKPETETNNQPVTVSKLPTSNTAAKPKPSKPVTSATTSKKKTIYLTFDDGPQRFSVDILKLLQKYDAKATFFMLDGNMKKYPEAVKQMVKTGHGTGMHGVSHDKKKFYQSSATVLSEMNQTRDTLKTLSGLDSNLIRTPYGSKPGMTTEFRQAVVASGYEMWDWNIDSMDWYYRDERYVASVIDQLEKKKGKAEPLVILLHERPETLVHLPLLLEYLKKQNYECQPLSSVMEPVAFK